MIAPLRPGNELGALKFLAREAPRVTLALAPEFRAGLADPEAVAAACRVQLLEAGPDGGLAPPGAGEELCLVADGAGEGRRCAI